MKIIYIFVLVALFCYWNTTASGETPETSMPNSSDKPCSIKIWTTKTTYALGEPIIVYAQEKNEGSEAYMLSRTAIDVVEHVELFREYKVILNGIKKHRVIEKFDDVPLTSFGKAGFETEIRNRNFYSCEPGEKSRLMPGWLNLWYDMTVPGEYNVKVTRNFYKKGEASPILIESNELTIEVVRGGFAYLKVDLDAEVKKERDKHEKPKE